MTVWRKSTKSGANAGQCVELGLVADQPHVRDSKDKSGPTLNIGRDGLTSLVADIKAGRLG